MDQTVVFLLAAILIVAALIFLAISIVRKGKKYLDVEVYRAKCLKIEHQLKKDEPASYHLAVLNADKLVDQALRELGMNGQTMGERLRDAVKMFSDRSGIWEAHKLRNVIAHEADAQVSYDQARHALMNFRKALKDLGAI